MMKIGDAGFELPIESVTDTHAVLAIRGAGKTYTASVMAEEMLEAGQQVVVIDPTGAWFGLRSSADGKREGYPIVVFGGDQADVPLSEHSGELIARAVVERRFSCILDVGHFTKGQMVRFLTAFLRQLYLANRNPLHLFVDEADDIAPQRFTGEKAKLVGAIEDVVKRGRRRGIGCTLVTQRPASLNKDVLTQCQTLIAMRMSHPRDIAAIREWVDVHGDRETAAKMIESLPGLRTSLAWVWAPLAGTFEQITVRLRRTYDSSATPKVGRVRKAPPRLSSIDFAALGQEIEALAGEAAANDPAKLRAEVARLRRELDTRKPVVDETVIAKAVAAAVAPYRSKLADVASRMVQPVKALTDLVDLAAKAAQNGHSTAQAARMITDPITRPAAAAPHKKPRLDIPRDIPCDAGDAKLGKAERAILAALAQYPNGKPQKQLGVVTGYSHKGGGFNNAISRLRSQGMLAGSRDLLQLTHRGIAYAGTPEPLPTGQALLDHWRRQLGKAERAILGQLVVHGPCDRSELAERVGYAPTGGGFNNALSRLRTLELIHGRDTLEASAEFFE